MDTRWSPTTKYIVAIGFALGGIALVYISRPVLGMLIFALIIAFLTHPIVRFMQNRLRFPRGLATITAYLLLILVVALIPIIVTPIAIDAIRAINIDAFVGWLQSRIGGAEEWLTSIRTIQLFHVQVSLASIVDPILDTLAGPPPNK
jgi:predicted PurR-regulated permease PerM